MLVEMANALPSVTPDIRWTIHLYWRSHMMALIGTRKATTFLRLAIVLALAALTSSTTGDRGTTGLQEHGTVCFVIDGQIYCIP